jgi:hypothetical protein
MHKTAFEIGGLAIDIYAGGPNARILDLGAYDVNGSLRDHARPGMDYIGADIEAGPGVDVVVKPGKRLPFDDESFDLVVASSVFEHDSAFWDTFAELVRVVRKGGHIYINVPSNGGFHRYPEDHWRFYPDSGLALERWAKKCKRPVKLIESFISEQHDANWNDFCAIFARMPAEKPFASDFVYMRVPSYNIHTWQSSEVIRARGETQDMLLIAAAQQDARQALEALEGARSDLEQVRAEADKAAHSLTDAHHQIHQVESELRQREEEIAQYRTQLATSEQTAADLADTQTRLAESEQWVANLARIRTESQKDLARLEAELARAEKLAHKHARTIEANAAELGLLHERQRNLAAEVCRLEKLHHESNLALQRTEAESDNRLDELRKLARLLGERDNEFRDSTDRAARLEAHLAEREAQVASLRSSSIEEARIRAEAEQKAEHRLHELGAVRQDLDEIRMQALEKDWLRHVHMTLASQPRWWALLLPSWRRNREMQLLLADGLFDAESYLAHYPDVQQAGMDPLRHYIWHGMGEGRRRRFD